MNRIAVLFATFFTFIAPAGGADRAVTVFAAASLRGALDEVAAAYDAPVQLSFGGSGTMARQVAAGAPADVVILANTLWMDWLVDQGLVNKTKSVARNALVVIAAAGTPTLSNTTQLISRLGTDRLAMGQRDAVPAGRYARQWLQAAGLWQNVAGNLAETDNVRAALALVARGEVPFGVVYATDALAEPRVAPVWNIASDLHDPITYPAAALTPEGETFLDHLTGAIAAQIFAAHGFSPVAE